MMADRFEVARNHLTEAYIAPVPSQFTAMPRAMERADTPGAEFPGELTGFSVLGYVRALAEDCIAWTGGGMDAPL